MDFSVVKNELNNIGVAEAFLSKGVVAELENLNHRLDIENGRPSVVVSRYRLKNVNLLDDTPGGAKRSLRTLPGFQWHSEDEFEFRAPDTDETNKILRAAFPWVRRLRFEEFMQVYFAYWAFFVLALCKIILSVSAAEA